MQNTPLKVFVVYAHEDKPVRDKLLRQLRPLADNGEIDLWSDHEIKPGELWDDAIRARLAQSDLILLLVSDDFFASDYIRNVELREALARHNRGETRLLPIIARHCGWEDLPALARLQVLPPDGRPVVSKEWDSPDEPYRKIYEGVKTVVRELRRKTFAQMPAEETPESPPKNVKSWKPLAFVSIFALVAVVGVWSIMLTGKTNKSTDNQGQVVPPISDTVLSGNPKNDTAQSEQSLKSSPEFKKGEAAKARDKVVPLETKPLAKPLDEKSTPPQTRSQPKTEPEKPKFDRQLPAVEGMARVIKGRQQGFLNTANGQVIGWYDDAENFNNGRAYVKQNNRYFWIDKTGRCVENCQ
jgi:hypothetical protein